MRVLFLDIDGVLNSSRTAVAHGGFPFSTTPADLARVDLVALGLVRNLCNVADVSVVLSSSWRIGRDHHDVAAWLDLPIVGATPVLAGNRGTEIAAWLAAHPEVDGWAIVDDDADMLDSQRRCFVRTDNDEGLSWVNYLELCDLFGVNPYDRAP